jgi:plastocyanin
MSEETTGRQPGRLPPIFYPLFAVVFGGILVWSFSRILLTVNKTAAAAIALLTALNVLIGAALVAYGPRVRQRSAAFPLVAGAAIAIVAAGIVAFTFGDHPPEKATATKTQTVALTAQSLKFLETKLSVAAGGEVNLQFTNKDSGVPHNFVLFKGTSATGPMLFRGAPVTGPGSTKYTFAAPPPGSFFFHCEFHPTSMTGTLIVTSGGGAAGGGPPSGGSPGVQATAKNIAFQPTALSAPGGGTVVIHFVNQDPQITHSIVVFDGPDATSPALFTGKPLTGPGSTDYSFQAPPPGTYFFHCQFHPTTMRGTLKIGP